MTLVPCRRRAPLTASVPVGAGLFAVGILVWLTVTDAQEAQTWN
ncbi:hypothetical protein [Nocardiopsis metallicus]|uniref:Uncharacterized protein n=1 Tax=Nocardiopsis metallicus TaxID=179819 RepID=A0A840W3V1_9ACTN|nr:hypothetical protein [Nocardiopsis metallicus]MBB5490742.1 hypothetical protein [Nocardiopsis metallicus]